MEYYGPHHPENTQFGSYSNEGLHELLNPFKEQQIVNTKFRRDPRLSLYRSGQHDSLGEWSEHFHRFTSNPNVYNVFPNEVVWRHHALHPTTFPEGGINEIGYTALNGLSPLLNLRPVGVAAGGSDGDGMTDFAVTESGLVNLISTEYDISAGDWVVALFPSLSRFTSAAFDDDRQPYAVGGVNPPRQPGRPQLQSIIPAGLPSEKLMAVIVPIHRLLSGNEADACVFASAMNGMFVSPAVTRLRGGGPNPIPYCMPPSYVRQQFQLDANAFRRRVRDQNPDLDLRNNCYPITSQLVRASIWHEFGLGIALNNARKGRAFQCVIGGPFLPPDQDWEPRPQQNP